MSARGALVLETVEASFRLDLVPSDATGSPQLPSLLAAAGRALVERRRHVARGDWSEAARAERRLAVVAQKLSDLGYGADPEPEAEGV